MKKRLLIFGSLFSIAIMLNIPVITAIEFNSTKQEIVENLNDILEVNNKELLFGCIFKFFSKLVGLAGYLTSMVLSLIILTIGRLLAHSLIRGEGSIIVVIVALLIAAMTGYTSANIFVKGYEFALKRFDKLGEFIIKISGVIFLIGLDS